MRLISSRRQPDRVGPSYFARDGYDSASSPAADAGLDESGRSPSDGQLAWQLAGEINERLNAVDRTAAYLKLGCGDHFEAIVYILVIVGRRQIALTSTITAQLARWAQGYSGSPAEPAIRNLMAPILEMPPQQTASTSN